MTKLRQSQVAAQRIVLGLVYRLRLGGPSIKLVAFHLYLL